MDAEGLVPVRLNQDWRDIKLKLIGDKLYIVGDKSEGMYAIKDQKTKNKWALCLKQERLLLHQSMMRSEISTMECVRFGYKRKGIVLSAQLAL